MAQPLTQKFLALVVVKGIVVGYAQWVGALVEPSALPVTMHPSKLGDEVRLIQPISLETMVYPHLL